MIDELNTNNRFEFARELREAQYAEKIGKLYKYKQVDGYIELWEFLSDNFNFPVSEQISALPESIAELRQLISKSKNNGSINNYPKHVSQHITYKNIQIQIACTKSFLIHLL